MESTTRGRSAAVVDDVGDGRRFPDPPPPHGRDTNSASADMAALVFRREQLLQELHRERIRHDMIMYELAETERVMTACLAGQGAWCGRPLMTPWEEAMYRTSRSGEKTSWWHRSASEPAIAPVYPRVERSPSPVLQPRPVDHSEKQEYGSSSRPLAVAPSASRDVEQCPSLSKQPAVEEALVPAVTNVVARPDQLALLTKEVTLESRGAVDHEHEAGLKDRHGVQLMQSGIQINEQLNRGSVDQGHEAEAKDTHARQLMDCEILRDEQPMHAAAGPEGRAEAKDSHAMQKMECETKRSEQLNRAAVGRQHEVDTNVRHAVQLMESFRRIEQVKHEAVDQEHEAEVNNHEAQVMESDIHRSEPPKSEAFAQEHEAEQDSAVQLSKTSEQPKPAEPTIKDQTGDERRQLPHLFGLAGKEKSPPNEQKSLVFNEPNTQTTPSGVKGNQILGPIVETPPPKRHKPLDEWSCTFCQVSLRCEEDLRQHQAGDLHQLILASLKSRQETVEFTAKSTPESSHRAFGFSRKLVRPILHNNFEKSEPQKASWAFGFDMRNHLNHTSHQKNRQALHAEEAGKEGSKHAADSTGTGHPTNKFVTKRRLPFCELCKVQCNSEKMMASHLGGKKHRENIQARR